MSEPRNSQLPPQHPSRPSRLHTNDRPGPPPAMPLPSLPEHMPDPAHGAICLHLTQQLWHQIRTDPEFVHSMQITDYSHPRELIRTGLPRYGYLVIMYIYHPMGGPVSFDLNLATLWVEITVASRCGVGGGVRLMPSGGFYVGFMRVRGNSIQSANGRLISAAEEVSDSAYWGPNLLLFQQGHPSESSLPSQHVPATTWSSAADMMQDFMQLPLNNSGNTSSSSGTSSSAHTPSRLRAPCASLPPQQRALRLIQFTIARREMRNLEAARSFQMEGARPDAAGRQHTQRLRGQLQREGQGLPGHRPAYLASQPPQEASAPQLPQSAALRPPPSASGHGQPARQMPQQANIGRRRENPENRLVSEQQPDGIQEDSPEHS
ncbi:hypothetical protein AAE478_004374 [Parahypoxylon ruwenzoriense]